MDEVYVKMCDCPEIQGGWEPTPGDRLSENDSLWYFPNWDRSGAEIDISKTAWDELAQDIKSNNKVLWLPRQEDWQNILFSRHYAPAIPNTARKIRAAAMIMFREHLDYMEAWKIEQPCEAWARLFMNVFHKRQWTEKGWQ